MRVIIAGPRTLHTYETVAKAVRASKFEITRVVSGGARGADTLGERWAGNNEIPVSRFLPAYERHGIRAPLMRNTQMAEFADALIAVWDGDSRGTGHMIREARRFGIPVYIYEI